MSDPVLATLTASPPRRILGTAMLSLLGGLLIYLAFALPFGGTQFALIGAGLVALLAASRLYVATAQVLELTEAGLRVKDGPMLAELGDIERVERGAFAFKPSNGFLVTLKTKGPRRWAPGLFWAFSRRLGIGGVTGAPQTKGMAEALSAMVLEHQGKS